jgi:hypothetical protein
VSWDAGSIPAASIILFWSTALPSAPGRSSKALLQTLVKGILAAVSDPEIRGRLWIVEPGRIRRHERSDFPEFEVGE